MNYLVSWYKLLYTEDSYEWKTYKVNGVDKVSACSAYLQLYSGITELIQNHELLGITKCLIP